MRVKRPRFFVVILLCWALNWIPALSNDEGYKYEVEVEPLNPAELNQAYNDVPKDATWTGFPSDPVQAQAALSMRPSNQDTVGGCHTVLDLALLLDASYSVTSKGWDAMTTAAKQLIDDLDVSPSGTHVSLMKFSTDVETFYMFDAQADKAKLKKLIDKMDFDGQWSRTDIALEAVNDHVFIPEAGARPSAPRAIVLFTDGRTDGPVPLDKKDINWMATLIKPLEHLKANNIKVFPVAIGNHPEYSQLDWIAGDRAKVFDQANVNRLADDLGRVGKRVCPYGSANQVPESNISRMASNKVAPSVCTSTPATCSSTSTCYPQLPTCIVLPPKQPCTPITTTCERTNTITSTKMLAPTTCTVTTTLLSTCTPTQTCYPQVPTCIMVAANTPCNATTTTCVQVKNVTKTEYVQPVVTCTATTTVLTTCTPKATCYPPNMQSCVNVFMMQACNTITSTVTCTESSVTGSMTATVTPTESATVTPTTTVSASPSSSPVSSEASSSISPSETVSPSSSVASSSSVGSASETVSPSSSEAASSTASPSSSVEPSSSVASSSDTVSPSASDTVSPTVADEVMSPVKRGKRSDTSSEQARGVKSWTTHSLKHYLPKFLKRWMGVKD